MEENWCQARPTASDTGLQGVCLSCVTVHSNWSATQLETPGMTLLLVTEFSKMVTSSW